jgi:hypothetical protein
MTTLLKHNLFSIFFLTVLSGCGPQPLRNITETGILPAIDPDYTGITIPFNMAPLNFKINEDGNAFFVRFSADSKTFFEIRSGNGIIKLPEGKWKKMLLENKGK